MQSIQAKVKYPCDRDYESKQPGAPNYTTLKVDIAGREERVFLNEGTPEYAYAKELRKGESVLLGEDKGKYKLIINNPMSDAVQRTTPAPQKPQKLDPEKAKDYALTYAAIFKLLEDKMGVAIPPDVVKDAASTVFISMTDSKRF